MILYPHTHTHTLEPDLALASLKAANLFEHEPAL